MATLKEKILVIHEWYPPLPGGSQTYIHEMLKRFPAPGNIIVFTGTHEGAQSFDSAQPFPIIRSASWGRAPGPLSKLRVFPLFLEVCRILRRHGPVKRIIAGHILPTGLLALALRVFFRIPYTLFTYGEEISDGQGRSSLIYRIKKAIAGLADSVVTISRHTRGLVRALGVPEDRIILAPPGIDPGTMTVDPEEVAAVRRRYEGKKILLTVSRLERRKGQDQVIRLMPELRARYGGRIVYLLIGSGQGAYMCEGDEEYLRGLVRSLDLEGTVFFLGSLPDEEVKAHLGACDLFVMPNRPNEKTGGTEGFGIVFLEANIMGKPVIGGRSGGSIDAVEDGKSGFLVDPTDLAEIRTGIVQLLDDPLKADGMGEYGRLRAERSFTWEAGSGLIREALESK